MIEYLEEKKDRIKNDLLEILKTEENFDLAVKVFEVSNRYKFATISNEYKTATEQARYTIIECLNELFADKHIDFWSGDIPLYRKLEMYIVSKDHIRVLEGYKENDSAVLFTENVELGKDINDDFTWLAEIDAGKIEYTLFEDYYEEMFCIDIDAKPEKELMEQVKKWYIDNGFELKEM